jgi:hypothetical protein
MIDLVCMARLLCGGAKGRRPFSIATLAAVGVMLTLPQAAESAEIKVMISGGLTAAYNELAVLIHEVFAGRLASVA